MRLPHLIELLVSLLYEYVDLLGYLIYITLDTCMDFIESREVIFIGFILGRLK
jgi:hypothetical protein